jgi:hypothetical protein
MHTLSACILAMEGEFGFHNFFYFFSKPSYPNESSRSSNSTIFNVLLEFMQFRRQICNATRGHVHKESVRPSELQDAATSL